METPLTFINELLGKINIPHKCELNGPGGTPGQVCVCTIDKVEPDKILVRGVLCGKRFEMKRRDFIKYIKEWINFYKDQGLIDRGEANELKKLLEQFDELL